MRSFKDLSIGLCLIVLLGTSVRAQEFQLPASDPTEEHPIELLPAARQHPRLLFTQADVPDLIARSQGPCKPILDLMEKYLPACVAPTNTAYVTDATDAQRQGAWRLPTVALHYVLAHDPRSLKRASDFLAVLCKQEHWEVGEEEDSGMAAANIMFGVALAYDWLYNDLDPQLRATVRAKLLLQARRMYYFGHLMKRGRDNSHYWQNDTQNNHRWHRDGGLVLAVLAIDDGQPDDQWLVARVKDELDLVGKWLPPDGSSHESSSYQEFGMPYLGAAFDAASHCLPGPNLMQNPYFQNLPMFRMQTLAPGLTDSFSYGDSGGTGSINDFNYRCTGFFHEADLQAGLEAFNKASPDAFMFGWFSMVWFDPKVTGGSLDHLPLRKFFPDLGMSFFRDGWQTQNVGFMFKCCPYGGVTLNEYRDQNDFHYINVAHDDPDANMFVLYDNGRFLADDDRYAEHKVSSSHNTILVDGKGEIGEGQVFSQPVAGDMLKMAYTTASRLDGPIAAAEGEAGKAYRGLDRYRRGVYWLDHRYVMILDDIDANQGRDLTSLIQGKQVSIVDAAADQYWLGPAAGGCGLTIISSVNPQASIALSTAESHGRSLGFQQLHLNVHAAHWRIVYVFDPWNHKPAVKVTPANADGTMQISVDADGTRDEWQWTPPAGDHEPSAVQCSQAGKVVFTLKP